MNACKSEINACKSEINACKSAGSDLMIVYYLGTQRTVHSEREETQQTRGPIFRRVQNSR